MSLCRARIRALLLALNGWLLISSFGHQAVRAVLRVVQPVQSEGAEQLSQDIDHQLALFGHPPYGTSLVGRLVLAPQVNRDGCQRFDRLQLAVQMALDDHFKDQEDEYEEDEATRQHNAQQRGQADLTQQESSDQVILMVQRGHCHFVEKARNAQEATVNGLVIYDTAPERRPLPIMADDGTGGDVVIPSVLIHWDDAQKLMELMNQSTTILQMSWEVTRHQDHAEYSLWFSSRDPALHQFIETFHDIAMELGNKATFTPRYEVYDGSNWGCHGKHKDSVPNNCDKLCVFDEKFCTFDPEQNNTIGLDGKDVLEEDVRQLCVHEVADQRNDQNLFWQYLIDFNRQCSPVELAEQSFTAECSSRVQQQLNISGVEDCVGARGIDLLQEQVVARKQNGILTFPQWTVNMVQLFGSIDCDHPISPTTCPPLRMICSGFSDDSEKPEACSTAYWKNSCVTPAEQDDCGDCAIRDSDVWNARCKGCDGVLNSGMKNDVCGVCGGDGHVDICGKCLQSTDPSRGRSCLDCEGTPNGDAKLDACGVCNGHGSFDACGLCLDANDPRRQNFRCRVDDDPDAVKAKAEISGISVDQFDANVLSAFQHAIGFLVATEAEQVLVKTIDPMGGDNHSCQVFFFVACDDEFCRENTLQKLKDPSASLEIEMKMRSEQHKQERIRYIQPVAHLIDKIRLHSISSDPLPILSATTRNGASHMVMSEFGPTLGVLCLLGLGVLFVAMKVREERMRRDFYQMFSTYTPLTAMEEQDAETNERFSSFD